MSEDQLCGAAWVALLFAIVASAIWEGVMTLFYYEHRSLGRWWPRTEPQEPTIRSTEGGRPKIRGVIEVASRHADLSLKGLQARYSRDGSLIYTQGAEHVKKVMSLP